MFYKLRKTLIIFATIILFLNSFLFFTIINAKNIPVKNELLIDKNKIFLFDKSIVFKPGGKNAQEIIDSDPNFLASTYYNPIYDPAKNYANTHFVAHNTSAFGDLVNSKKSDIIMISDDKGRPFFYSVSRIEKIELDFIETVGIASSEVGKQVIKEIKESTKREVVFQTCVENIGPDKTSLKKYTVILVFAKELN